ncbi:hypothetical protein D3C75_1356730 [compost metagenome]|jgi:hypothetical protein
MLEMVLTVLGVEAELELLLIEGLRELDSLGAAGVVVVCFEVPKLSVCAAQ